MTIRLRILVTGGRNFRDKATLRRWIFDAVGLELESHEICVIHGDASGADKLADEIAKEAGFHVSSYPANWDDMGIAAGVMRNTYMLVDSCPDIVIAAPGGRGTHDMVSKVRAAIKRGKNIKLIDKR